MGRPLRHLPEREDGKWQLVEYTSRTFQRRLLLTPGMRFVRLFIGLIARAQRLTGVLVHEVIVLGNHFHILASVEDVRMQARFLGLTKRWMSDEVQRHSSWTNGIWRKRYDPIPISDEEEAQYKRLEYVYSQGVKENLVADPEDWPGVSTVSARTAGYDELEGDWIDRTAMSKARGRGESPRAEDYTIQETLRLSPMPMWRHLSKAEYRRRCQDLVKRIRETAMERHRKNGTKPLGRERLRRMDPLAVPAQKGPVSENERGRPMFHTATRAEYRRLRRSYELFFEAYRSAAEKVRRGQIGVKFPTGCFLPPPSFGHGWLARAP